MKHTPGGFQVHGDLFVSVLGFCDAQTLAVASVVSRKFRRLCADNETYLWAPLVGRAFSPWASKIPAAEATKSAYGRKLKERTAKVRTEDERWGSERAELFERQRRIEATSCLDFFHIRLLPPLFAILLLLQLVTASLSADGAEGWNPAVVMVPLWLVFGGVFLAAASGYMAHRLNLLKLENDHDLIFLHGLPSLLARSQSACAGSTCCFSALLSFFALVAVSASGHANALSWSVSFSPLWIVLFIIFFSPCIVSRRCEATPLHLALVVCLGIPALSVSILSLLRLEGASISAWAILTPIWIIDALLLCIPLAAFCKAVASRRRGQAMGENNVRDTMALLLGVFCAVLPWVIFEILLCVHVEERILRVKHVLAPLMAAFSFYSLVVCAYAETRRPLRPRLTDSLPV